MKAYVKAGIEGFSGKLDGAIYYYHPRSSQIKTDLDAAHSPDADPVAKSALPLCESRGGG